ncbi:MAG: class I SAM-dependent methyltransferase [bacterium]
MLYEAGKVPESLKYEGLSCEVQERVPLSRWRRKISFLRNAVRWRLNRAGEELTPRCPVGPDYWMGRIAEILPQRPRNILDFGGGDGRYKSRVARQEDAYTILEPDESSFFVRGNKDKYQYVIGDGHTCLFQKNVFDVILMLEVLEHVSDPATIIRNCGDWLKPGGILIISAPQYWHIHAWPHDYYRYTIYGLQHLVTQAGLNPVQHWAMGGPCVLMWCVADLNFAPLFRMPVFKHLISYPLLMLAKGMDRLFFRHNEKRRNPDTRGWMLVARKPPL